MGVAPAELDEAFDHVFESQILEGLSRYPLVPVRWRPAFLKPKTERSDHGVKDLVADLSEQGHVDAHRVGELLEDHTSLGLPPPRVDVQRPYERFGDVDPVVAPLVEPGCEHIPIVPPAPDHLEEPMSVSKLIASASALYARLSKDARSAVEDAAKYAGAAAATLGSLAAVLPALHVPAADTAVVASAGAVLTGFVSWAVRHHLAAASKPAASAPAPATPAAPAAK